MFIYSDDNVGAGKESPYKGCITASDIEGGGSATAGASPGHSHYFRQVCDQLGRLFFY